jgi:outer membrane protein assembly factor BamA
VEVDVPVGEDDLTRDVNISALYLTQVLDTRDTFFLPTRGRWLRVRADFSLDELGTELPFVRLDGRHVRYHPLRPGTVLAWTARLGVIVPLEGDEEIPLQERYFNGGQNTVRSFREDELGPRDADGDPIGGEAFSVASVELRQDIVGDFSLALFADAGNVSLEASDALAFDDMRFGVGPGLRWLLPIGPVRLDWGINPDPRPEERDWVLQFSLGVAF